MDIWSIFDLFRLPCTCCGLPAPGSLAICAGCLADLPPPPATAGRVRAACAYAFPVDRLVQQLKFDGRLAHARLLGGLLAGQAVHWPRPQALVPVPLHRERLRTRGYNQAEAIAAHCARRLGLPLATGAVLRVRATAAQTGLDRAARRRNLRDAFALVRPLPAHVALVDDVVTTGATLAALAATLRRAGVARVDAWCVARAGGRDDPGPA